MAMTIVEAARAVTGGVDTHGDVHVAAALDEVGSLLGTESFGATPEGYSALLTWLGGFGPITKVGVEGTGAYGAGLARFLAQSGLAVIEVDRQNRQARRRSGKSDPIDAIEAARAAMSGRASGLAKSRDGAVEAIRVLVWPSARPARPGPRRSSRCASWPSPPLTSSRAGSRAWRSPSSWRWPRACAPPARPTR